MFFYLAVVIFFVPSCVAKFLHQSTKTDVETCIDDVFRIEHKRAIHFKIKDIHTSKSTYCVLELVSPPETHIRLDLEFSPPGEGNCTDYVHVGNDRQRINMASMTSYKYCSKTVSEEIISRHNYMWVAFRVSKSTEYFNINVSSHRKAECSSAMFECSPVQCIETNRLCDGVPDCDNGRDEFCQMVTGAANGDECFRCRDGTCIRPTLPRYNLDFGKTLWYLCDGYNHCQDGSDERKDICLRVKGRSSAVISCIPADATTTTPVLMWDIVMCNGVNDCRDGEDETSEKCFRRKKKKKDFVIDKTGVAFAVFFTAVGIAVVVVIALKHKRKKRSCGNDDTGASNELSEQILLTINQETIDRLPQTTV